MPDEDRPLTANSLVCTLYETMRTPPEDDDDQQELSRLNVEPWMIDHLKLNPEYVHWGPGEDYMSTKGESWGASQEVDGWSAFGPWDLDELNECVHFYFELDRPSEKCEACDHSGYNPETKIIADTFYDFGDFGIDFSTMTMHGSIESARKPNGATGRKWSDKITQDEVDALVSAGRLGGNPVSAAEVNAANSGAQHGFNRYDHDAINRSILIETRAKRLGVYGMCPSCEGRGYVFAAARGHLNVVLWMLHPRKGCSRGVRVRNLSAADADAAKQWLREAARRNVQRFGKLL